MVTNSDCWHLLKPRLLRRRSVQRRVSPWGRSSRAARASWTRLLGHARHEFDPHADTAQYGRVGQQVSIFLCLQKKRRRIVPLEPSHFTMAHSTSLFDSTKKLMMVLSKYQLTLLMAHGYERAVSTPGCNGVVIDSSYPIIRLILPYILTYF